MKENIVTRLQWSLLGCNFSMSDISDNYQELLDQLWYEFGYNGAKLDIEEGL